MLWTLLSVDSLVNTEPKKCVFQFSVSWAFLSSIKPILKERKLLWSHLIRTNDRCCKQAECFNSDPGHWFASAANYCVDWGYLFSSSRRKRLLFLLYIAPQSLNPILNKNLPLTFMLNKMSALGLIPRGPPSVCQVLFEGKCLYIKWLQIRGNDMVCGCQLPGSQVITISSIMGHINLTVTCSFCDRDDAPNWKITVAAARSLATATSLVLVAPHLHWRMRNRFRKWKM